MITMQLTGPWNEAVKDFDSFARNLEAAAQRAVGKEAIFWAKEVRDGIRTQKSAREARPPWPPLADSTLAAKKPKSKMLIDTGTLLRSIIGEKVANWRWLVGVKRGARTKTGEDLVNVAAVHEFGAGAKSTRSGGTRISIPARPFIQPVFNRLSKSVEGRLWERLDKEISKHLKHRNIVGSM